MISTVTTTVTTVAVGGTLGAIASLLLIFLLSGKEVADAGEGTLSGVLSKNLNVAIVPLLLTFVFIVFAEIATVI